MAKEGILSVVLVSLVMLQVSVADESCSLSFGSLKQAMASCMIHEPTLMWQMYKHMDNPQTMESLDFVCSNQGPIVDTLLCLEKKLIKCMPQGGHIMAQLLPDRPHTSEGVKFLCEKRNVFTDMGNCMDQEVQQKFVQCYTTRLESIMDPTQLTSMSQIKSAMCSVIRADENCFKLNHGTCSAMSVNTVIELLEKFFPTDQCSAATQKQASIKNVEMKNSLGSILLQGAPLRFQPDGAQAKYRIYRGRN